MAAGVQPRGRAYTLPRFDAGQAVAARLPKHARAWHTVYGRGAFILVFAALVLSQLWIEPASRIDAAVMLGLFAAADGVFVVTLVSVSRTFAPARRPL